MIAGINHITLSVRDVEHSFEFYADVLGFKPRAKWSEGAYLTAGDTWVVLVKDDKVRYDALREYTHIAFTVSAEDFERVSNRIKASGARTWKDNTSEGDSLYFLDPNGHKLEIHVGDLESRLASAKKDPWPGLEFFNP